MADRPYLTSAEAATYCGFKTIGGIQQAVRRGKLKPAGRRGGTGTYVFAKEDLDAFLTGGLQPHERLFVPPELNEAARLGAASPRDNPSPGAQKLAPPAPEPAGNRAPRAAARPSPKPAAGRGRKPPAADKDDPVARIVQALSGAARKLEKNAKRSR